MNILPPGRYLYINIIYLHQVSSWATSGFCDIAENVNYGTVDYHALH